jgi:hypothetical protein
MVVGVRLDGVEQPRQRTAVRVPMVIVMVIVMVMVVVVLLIMPVIVVVVVRIVVVVVLVPTVGLLLSMRHGVIVSRPPLAK